LDQVIIHEAPIKAVLKQYNCLEMYKLSLSNS